MQTCPELMLFVQKQLKVVKIKTKSKHTLFIQHQSTEVLKSLDQFHQ